MTTKFQAILAAWIAGTSAFVAWLMTLPPESQTALLAPLIDVAPLEWRPAIGLFTRTLATVTTIYATYKAAHAGPQSPPVNKPE
jgi:hypothetical protein